MRPRKEYRERIVLDGIIAPIPTVGTLSQFTVLLHTMQVSLICMLASRGREGRFRAYVELVNLLCEIRLLLESLSYYNTVVSNE